jgi:hypothetical protein
MSEPLPFTCPSCGESFGLGSDAALLGVVKSVPVNGEAAPCCGALIWGRMNREPLTLEVYRWETS